MRLFIKRAITDKDPENYYGKGCVLEPFGVLLYSHMQVVDCFKVIRKDLASVNGGLGDLAQADMRTAERKQYIDQHRYEMLMIGGKGLVTFLKYAYQHDITRKPEPFQILRNFFIHLACKNSRYEQQGNRMKKSPKFVKNNT